MNSIKEKSDYDSPWKEMLELFFEQFISFFFPYIHAEIDWTKQYEFLDKELQKVVRDAKTGRQHVDKLVKICRTNGQEAWVLIHVEIQVQFEEDFAKRIYRYNYRLFDRYDRPIVSLAILADDRKNWKPENYSYGLWGSKTTIEFPVVKLLDMENEWNKLEQSLNPFAIITMAHLKAISTRLNPDERLTAKIDMARLLYKKGYSRQQIIELYRFLDWIMKLPDDLETKFYQTVTKFEEVNKMPYISYVERIGMERGFQQGLLEGHKEGHKEGMQKGLIEGIALALELKFGAKAVPELSTFRKIKDVDVLLAIYVAIKTAKTVEELRKIYQEIEVAGKSANNETPAHKL